MGLKKNGAIPALLQPLADRRAVRNRLTSDTAWRIVCMMSFVLLVASIFYLGERPVAVGLFPAPYDKLVHFTTFALLTFLLGFAGLRGFPLALFLVGITIGALDEMHQIFLPGRIGSWLDFLADFSAVLTTVLLLPATQKKAD